MDVLNYDPPVQRTCDACPGVDNHPRHAVPNLADPTARDFLFHMDCHALMGCPSCLGARKGLAPDVIGPQFRQHIVDMNNNGIDDREES